MGARVAYASISENGTINGALGDQTGKELRVRDYYNFGQTLYFRFNDSKDAWWMGDISERICNNDLVGYGQSSRTTIFNILKSNGWQSSKINKKCNCDCSELVVVSFNCIYEKILLRADTYTGNLKERLLKTGKGTIHTITSGYKPMCGDIVFKPNKHAVIVCRSIR